MRNEVAVVDRSWRRRAGPLAAGLVVGGIIGFAWVSAEERLGWSARLDPFQAAALVIGLLCVTIGLSVIAASFRPAMLSWMQTGDTVPATDQEARLARLAGVTFLLAGLMAAAPVVVLATGSVSRAGAGGLIAALAAGSLLQVWLNLLVWRRADELLRRASLEAAALAFLLFETGLFLWAAAALLGVAPEVSAWALWTVMFGLYLLAGFWAAARRGLG